MALGSAILNLQACSRTVRTRDHGSACGPPMAWTAPYGILGSKTFAHTDTFITGSGFLNRGLAGLPADTPARFLVIRFKAYDCR